MAQGLRPVVVCSASGDTSDRLESALDRGTSDACSETLDALRAHHEKLAAELDLSPEIVDPILRDLERSLREVAERDEVPARLRAEVMSRGELMSSRLVAAWLERQGLRSRWQDAREWLVGRRRDNPELHYLSAVCEHEVAPELRERVVSHEGVVVTQGFIARDDGGDTVLLGRGGSDTSAAYMSAMLDADHLEIWTDVPGMFTTDPRGTEEARLLRELSWDEAESIARLGGKVLHARCVGPVRGARIPIRVRSTVQPDLSGTRVAEPSSEAGLRAVAVRRDLHLVTAELDGIDAAAIARGFEQRGLEFEPLAASSDRLCGLVDRAEDATEVEEALDALDGAGRSQIIPDATMVSVVGSRIGDRLDRIHAALRRSGADPRSRRVEDLHASFVVSADEAPALAEALHEAVLDEDGSGLGESWAVVSAGTRLPSRSDTITRETAA